MTNLILFVILYSIFQIYRASFDIFSHSLGGGGGRPLRPPSGYASGARIWQGGVIYKSDDEE